MLTGFNNSSASTTKHGFHVHAQGSIGNQCNDAGGHYNPYNVVHGAPSAPVRHVGDLGNIDVNPQGVVNVTITDNIVSLTGNISVIGKAIVVHELEDDLGLGNSTVSNTTGNAGRRFGCCIITMDSGSTTIVPTSAGLLQLIALALVSYFIRA